MGIVFHDQKKQMKTKNLDSLVLPIWQNLKRFQIRRKIRITNIYWTISICYVLKTLSVIHLILIKIHWGRIYHSCDIGNKTSWRSSRAQGYSDSKWQTHSLNLGSSGPDSMLLITKFDFSVSLLYKNRQVAGGGEERFNV